MKTLRDMACAMAYVPLLLLGGCGTSSESPVSERTSTVTAADSTSAAAHYKDFRCFVYLAPAQQWLITTDTHSVTQTATPDGNSLTTCRFTGPEVDQTVIETGFGCSTDLGITYETRFVYTPSGHGTLTCLNNGAAP